MSKLPQIKPKQILTILSQQGFIFKRQTGSHARLIHKDGRKVTIAIHNKPIAPGTLHAILKQANLSRKELLKSLQ